MNTTKFTTRACDAIGYYVYCLIDPRDNKVFYIGKGKGDRVFAHIHNAVVEPDEKEKIKRINEIGPENVIHYVIRHSLSEKAAYELESTLIDFLMDKRVNGGNDLLSNLVYGHHHSDKGIKSIDEINAQYPEKEFVAQEGDKIIMVFLNSLKDSDNIYERARGDWAFTEEKIRQCTHVVAVYHGIVRAVYPVCFDSWEKTREKEGRKPARWRFTSKEDPDSPYLYAKIYSEETYADGKPLSRRRKVDTFGKIIPARRGALCVNY